MKTAKILIIFTFLLAFVLQVSAQDEKPKIVWKNLQEKYESFYDIRPTIINISNEPIYFNCSLTETNPVTQTKTKSPIQSRKPSNLSVKPVLSVI